MATLIQQAADKGWTVAAGTLQAKGLWHAFRKPIESDDDITLWCSSANDAAREALKMQREQNLKQKHNRRLPVRPEINTVTYHRPPTQGELKFGHGATHYRDFFIEECCHKGTRVLKKWFSCPNDGLRYYR